MTTPEQTHNEVAAVRPSTSGGSGRLQEFAGLLIQLFFLVLILLIPVSLNAQASKQFILQTAAGGAAITGSIPTYSTSFGALNAFGVGSPAIGVTAITLPTGTLYYSKINFVTGDMTGHHDATISAYVSTNFIHPSAMVLRGCPNNAASCTVSTNYTNLSTSAAAPTVIVPNMNESSTTTAGIAIFIPDNNGAGAFAGTDSATITFVGKDAQNGQALNTVTLSFNSQSLVTALQLTLSTATGGLTVNAASDYSMNFGNVNGIGVGPGAGLTVVPQAGGVIYSTPYTLTPAFSNFAQTTGTVKVAVSTNFAHSSVLSLRTAAASAGPYTTISTSVASPTPIATSVATRTAITNYLGLFVSTANGAGAFNGSDSATLTYTLTVP
jgi:hypothetical protein